MQLHWDSNPSLPPALQASHLACARADVDGADVDRAKLDGATPLFVSCQSDSVQCTAHLLAAGADVNKTLRDGASPLLISCYNGHAECVSLLLSARADHSVTWQGSDGQRIRPLQAALEEGHTTCVQLLQGAQLPRRFRAPRGPCAWALNLLPPSGSSPLALDNSLFTGALSRAQALGAPADAIATLHTAAAPTKAARRLAREGCESPFYFLRARMLLAAAEQGMRSLPPHHSLRESHADWLVVRTLSLADACRGEHEEAYVAVSHRWTQKDRPDPDGTQLAAIVEYLAEHPAVEYVFYDYSCMPQGDRTPSEAAETQAMLPNVPMLFLGCSSLLILDGTYASRFWPVLEAYLSLHVAEATGIVTTPAARRRCTVASIGHVPSDVIEVMIPSLAALSPVEAHQMLSSGQFSVARESDRVTLLQALLSLEGRVKALDLPPLPAPAAATSSQPPPPPPPPAAAAAAAAGGGGGGGASDAAPRTSTSRKSASSSLLATSLLSKRNSMLSKRPPAGQSPPPSPAQLTKAASAPATLLAAGGLVEINGARRSAAKSAASVSTGAVSGDGGSHDGSHGGASGLGATAGAADGEGTNWNGASGGGVPGPVVAWRLRAETAESRLQSLEREMQRSWEEMQSQLTAKEAKLVTMEADHARERHEWLRLKQELIAKVNSSQANNGHHSGKPRMQFHGGTSNRRSFFE